MNKYRYSTPSSIRIAPYDSRPPWFAAASTGRRYGIDVEQSYITLAYPSSIRIAPYDSRPPWFAAASTGRRFCIE